MRFFLISIFAILSFLANAQVKTWYDLFSTNNIRHLTATNNSIFAAAKNAILIYSPQTGMLERLSAQGELSDTSITAIYAQDNMVFVGYSSGDIDVIKDNKIINLSHIKNNLSLLPEEKKINAMACHNNMLWLATNYGITTLNMQNLNFDNTLYLSNNQGSYTKALDIVFTSNYIYLLTNKGLYYTDQIDYIPDIDKWHFMPLSNGKKLGLLYDKLYILTWGSNSSAIFLLKDSTFQQLTYQTGHYNMRIVDGKIFMLGDNILALNTSGDIINTYTFYKFGNKIKANDLFSFNGSIYIADQYLSLVKNFEQKISTSTVFSDKINAFKACDNQLFILHNTDSTDRAYGYRAVISIVHENGNIEIYSTNKVNEFLSIAIDPHDPNHWFLASDSIGLVEMRNKQITNIFTPQNSPLNVANSYIKISYIKYDQDGTLWILYNSSSYPVIKLLPDGTWQKVEASSIAVGQSFSHFIITSQNFFYAPVKKSGMFVINLNTDQARLFYPYYHIGSRINDIVEDKDGTIWFSTNDGLGYLTAQDFNAQGFKAVRPLVQVTLNDTTIYAYLLDNTNCIRLAIDDGNRKWVATTYFGIIHLEPDGLNELAHYNVNNQTIVTNKIYDIEYSPVSGTLYFITDQGIIAYRSDSSLSKKNFANVIIYPNPVRPYYKGPITIKGLKQNTLIKITDLQGNLIYEFRSNGGTAVWNGLSINGQPPHSGVYLIICTDEQGIDKCVRKLLIIR